MFERLDAPADLGSARARLAAEADRLAGSDPVHHLVELDHCAEAGGGQEAVVGADPPVGVLVADSVLWAATAAQLDAVAARIGPDRSLLFLEPTADVGWRRLVHRLGRPMWRRLAGHDFEADVPARLRSSGLDVVDLRRFAVGRAGVRSYVVGRAVRLSSR